MPGQRGNPGNTSARRGKPLARRIVLTEDVARRMAARAPRKEDVAVMVNIILMHWLEDQDIMDAMGGQDTQG